ncbi:unnamed protein product [Dracunculus medinensis]|uniref:Pkinase_fungal domain-containing protein n=1 Tax=Dracunculus medinensis TaxID=318479 RepID=A0A158Q3U2_DRAME|nr:unnamed protein product [Dracunculus medinensis]
MYKNEIHDIIVLRMYIFGDDDKFLQKIIAISNDLQGEKGYIIKNSDEILHRCNIIYTLTSINLDAIKKIISYTNNENILILVKEEWTKNEVERIDALIAETKASKIESLNGECNRLMNLAQCRSRDERINLLTHWIEKSDYRHYFITGNSPTIKSEISSILGQIYKFEHQPQCNLTDKPPPLHWSNFPREDELQITFKFNFPHNYFVNDDLETIINHSSESFNWSYIYKWTNGALFREKITKIGIVKHLVNILEISGRVDRAELDDEFENMPMKAVWPFLAIVLHAAISYLNGINLPYQLSILPIGDLFYTKNAIPPRSFDITQLLVSIDLFQRVSFRFNEELCDLQLQQLFNCLFI